MFYTIILFRDNSPLYFNLFTEAKVSRAGLCKALSTLLSRRIFQHRLNFKPENHPVELHAHKFAKGPSTQNILELNCN